MRKKLYVVSYYNRATVFDCNLRLVYRWYVTDHVRFTNSKKALKYFMAVNSGNPNRKAVLRVKYAKGGRK